jgi:heme ABC exporter ATP-binding subunit CcmA
MLSYEADALLDARGLRRAFGRVPIIRDIDIAIRPGEALAIAGPNGAGKTTLLRMLAGLLRPDAGEISVMGKRFGRGAMAPRQAIGLVAHQTLLYDDLTLLENLAFAARLYGLHQPTKVAVAALDAAALGDRAGELPRRLSRGLQQRAAIARALVHDPRIILMDEPFTGLDTGAADRLQLDLRARLSGGAGLLLVTHHLADVWDLATRVAVLVQGRWAATEPRAGTLEAFTLRYEQMIDG